MINALGADHITDTMSGSLVAADAYRLQAMEFQDTANRCAQRGVKYEPVVFTCQGGIQSNGESVLTRLAEAVAKAEGKTSSQIKAEIMQDLSRTWVRAAASAIARRRPREDEEAMGLERIGEECWMLR